MSCWLHPSFLYNRVKPLGSSFKKAVIARRIIPRFASGESIVAGAKKNPADSLAQLRFVLAAPPFVAGSANEDHEPSVALPSYAAAARTTSEATTDDCGATGMFSKICSPNRGGDVSIRNGNRQLDHLSRTTTAAI